MSLVRNTVLALTAAVAFGAAMTSTATTAHAWHYPHWKKHWHHPHHGYYRPYYRPYVYAAPVVYSAPRAAPAPRIVSAPPQPPVQAQTNCLSKAYTPEGQVVFSDNCTKESAMAPVPNVPQPQGAPPQQSQQQGEAPAPEQQQQNFGARRKFGSAQPQ